MNVTDPLFVPGSEMHKVVHKSSVRIKGFQKSLRDSLDKFYTFDQCEKYEKFLQELGTKKAVRLKALESKPTIILSKVKGEYILTTTYPEGKRVRIKFELGKEFQRRRNRGRVSGSIINLVGNKLVETQMVEGKEVVVTREFLKNELLITMEVNGVKCIRRFLPSSSKHSIGTETSRRSSICGVEERRNSPQVESVLQKKDYNPDSESESEENVCY